jgi:hypothetical protein
MAFNVSRLRRGLKTLIPFAGKTKIGILYADSKTCAEILAESKVTAPVTEAGKDPITKTDTDLYYRNLGRRCVYDLQGFTQDDGQGHETPLPYSPELVDELMASCDEFAITVNMHAVNLEKILATEEAAAAGN